MDPAELAFNQYWFIMGMIPSWRGEKVSEETLLLADNTELHPDCAQIHCEVREGLEAEDGEVTLTEPPLVHFRTRHCAHQESFLTCPKLGPAARRICRYYSQCFVLKCMSNVDDFRKNSRKCRTNLLQI